MRAAFIVFALSMLTACGSALHTHAQVASVSAQVIDEAGALIEREAADDVASIPAEVSDADRFARIAHLREAYHPVEVAYEALREQHAAYIKAIVEANARGDRDLAPDRIAIVKDAWSRLLDAFDAAGVPVPILPPALAGLLGGDQ